MNKIILMGRTTTDPTLIYTQSGKAVSKVAIAVDRKYKDASGNIPTDFIPLVVWGKLAETFAKYVSKGKKILIEGEMQVRSYDKDGEKRYMTEVVCSEIHFIDRMKLEE